MRWLHCFLLVGWVFISCDQQEQIIERPREAWVFRSVLDEKPRMVTAALSDELWIAYDAQKAELYKVWKGGVNFNGAVYTTVHGPQPTSKGYAYYSEEEQEGKSWFVRVGSKEYFPEVAYKGYSFSKGKVLFDFDLTLEDGTQVRVKEQPEYIKRARQNGISRVFYVDDLPQGVQIGQNMTLTSLVNEEHFSVRGGDFETIKSKEITFEDGITKTIEGKLLFAESGSTEIRIFYHPGFDNFEEGDAEEEEEISKGAKLINESDCRSCHNEQVKTVGPSYIAVARKYNDDESTIQKLAGKIINGGKGVWGEAVMTAHNDLPEGDANEMVRYILSLDDKETEGPEGKYAAGRKATPIRVDDFFTPNEGKGLATHYYVMNDIDGAKQVVDKDDPVRSGVTSALHALERGDLPAPGNNLVLEFIGSIDVPKDGSYDFRLVSDDESFLYLDGKQIIDNGGFHPPIAKDGEVYLKQGAHSIKVLYSQGGGGGALSLQWFDQQKGAFTVIEEEHLSHIPSDFKKTTLFIPQEELVKSVPGDAYPLVSVHPSFDLFQARPDGFQPKVGGIDFFSDGRMVLCTWDSLGQVFEVKNYFSDDPTQIEYKRIAVGLAEPLGIKVVDDEIYVLQKQELTKLIDNDEDGLIDEYQKISDGWRVSANFHEFAFGLVYQEGYFYATLATAILPGGASASPQIPDRGKVVKISKEDGSVEFIAKGLRTPNGIALGADGELFVADNQGDWLPASKIVHIREGAFYGSRSVNPVESPGWTEKLPVVWLPQDEIGNSPSEPAALNIGPYKGQMIHGEVTHGGLKRVFLEKVAGEYQGAVFRFTQGLEAGVNRIDWAPDGKSIIIGGIGSSGNWGHDGKLEYGLQRLTYNGKKVFDILAMRAKTNGIELEFTEPIKDGQYLSSSDFLVKQWYYLPTENYGGPKLDEEELKPVNFYLSDDRKRVFLELSGMKENHMIYVRVLNPPVAEGDLSLWTTEAWYTMNKIPIDDPGFTNNYQVRHNALSDTEKANGWKLLFDGSTTNGLRNYGKETLGNKWRVQNGALHFSGQGTGEGGDVVITDQPYQNFELYLEWKISKGGNSGIIYNSVESDEYGYAWMTGPEMQILDNERHSDGKIVKHRAGDLYDLIKTKYVTVNPPETWNKVRIVSEGGTIQHWQNGHKVVEYQIGTEQWKELIAGSKFNGWKGFGASNEGHIVLQDHGDKVWFRNIKIKAL